MCMEFSLKCECETNEASFHFQNDIMAPEVINKLYCPACSSNASFKPETMIADNGWLIEYDMDIALFSAQKLPRSQQAEISPAMLFDEGYATWRGFYPGDHIDSIKEREEVVKLAKDNPKEYLKKMKTWTVERMARMKEEGWRKANVN